MFKVFLIFLMSWFSFMLFPQAVNAEEKDRSFQVYLSVGGMRLTDTDDLNSELKKQGYPEVEERTGMFGGGLRYSGTSFIIGAQGHSHVGEEKKKDNYRVSYTVGYGLLEFGYIFDMGGIRIFPLIGIGGGGISINIREENSAGFNETLGTPERGSRLVHGDMIADLSVGMEYIIKLVESGGILLGAQVGYMYPVHDSGWKNGMSVKRNFQEMEDVSGGPDFKYAGPHFQVNLGWAVLL